MTPSPLPAAVRVGIGVIAWLAFLAYALVLGRAAHNEGADGDISADDRGEHSISVD